MAKKSVTPSIRMDEEVYQKMKALKEERRISWNELIKYTNELISEEMERNGK